MVNVRGLRELGRSLPFENNERPWETRAYERLHDELRESADGIKIAEVRQRPYGILVIATDELRRQHPIIGDAHAVLWYTDNDMHDADSGIRLIDEPMATKLRTECTSALINDVVEHYKTHSVDDGNPAYGLFRKWLAEYGHDTVPTPA